MKKKAPKKTRKQQRVPDGLPRVIFTKTRDVTSLNPGDRLVISNEGDFVHVAIERKQEPRP